MRVFPTIRGPAHKRSDNFQTAIWTDMVIHDNGIGVFKKIQQALNPPEERYAIVQLSKGKFTTDRSKHSGEGIFFTSKMVDDFDILSDDLSFTGKQITQLDWIPEKFKKGTTVWMKLSNKSSRQPKDVYDKFTEDFAFNKTGRLRRMTDKELITLKLRSAEKSANLPKIHSSGNWMRRERSGSGGKKRPVRTGHSDCSFHSQIRNALKGTPDLSAASSRLIWFWRIESSANFFESVNRYALSFEATRRSNRCVSYR